MKPAVAVVILLASAGCGGSASTPSAPSPPPASQSTPAPGTLILSGIVYELTPTGLRPLVGATVEITESTWADYTTRPTTDLNGRYAFGSLMPRHYLVRASKAGYDNSVVVNLGFMERSRNQNFELVPAGSAMTLTIESLEPASGSTGGGTSMTIAGTGFQSTTTVTIGGERVIGYAGSSTKLYVTAPAHTAGVVDVVLSKENGASATLARGFTYAPPQSFDFNGTWVGYALAHPPTGAAQVRAMHADMDMRLTVENNRVISFTCGGSEVAFSPPAISNGEFTLAPEGIAITGRIVAPNEVTGKIDTPACPATLWYAYKQ
jgi:hypothetical protein